MLLTDIGTWEKKAEKEFFALQKRAQGMHPNKRKKKKKAHCVRHF